MKKILIIFLCFAFSSNFALAERVHLYEKNERSNYQPEQEKVIYDFSDEAQERFDSKNLVPPQQIQPIQREFTLPKVTQTPIQGGVVYIEAGTQLDAMLNSSISSDSITNNDNVSAQLNSDWVVNGIVIAPEGSVLSGTITEAKTASFAMGNGKIGINFNRVMTPDGRVIPLSTNQVFIVGNSSRPAKIAGKVAAGAIGGVAIAALSMLFGADPKEALIRGAIIGGSIGTISAVATKGEEIMVQEGTNLQIMLSEPMSVQAY